jgi:hypothetical protein
MRVPAENLKVGETIEVYGNVVTITHPPTVDDKWNTVTISAGHCSYTSPLPWFVEVVD